MKTVILLMVRDTNGRVALTKPINSFNDWDWATLHCAKLNQIKKPLIGYYLQEIPFCGELEPANEFFITREDEEICISGPNDNKVYAYVKLQNEIVEEYYHESMPPYKSPSFNVDTITICGTELKNLKLSEDLIRSIEHEADNYKEEMIENINNASNFED
jgi:hypothetical protein